MTAQIEDPWIEALKIIFSLIAGVICYFLFLKPIVLWILYHLAHP